LNSLSLPMFEIMPFSFPLLFISHQIELGLDKSLELLPICTLL
jgi:hypothetical protein